VQKKCQVFAKWLVLLLTIIYSAHIEHFSASVAGCKMLDASVAELVDALDLGSSAVRCESSSLSARTRKKRKAPKVPVKMDFRGFFCLSFAWSSEVAVNWPAGKQKPCFLVLVRRSFCVKFADLSFRGAWADLICGVPDVSRL
jgi:hypothetical protein